MLTGKRLECGVTRPLAVVTGASSGTGAGLATAIAAALFDVVLVGRDRDRLEETAVRCREFGGSVDMCLVDLGDVSAAKVLSNTVQGRPVHLLVHAAGEYVRGPVELATDDEFETLMRSNVGSFMRTVRTLIPALRTGPGDVVLINSTQGSQGSHSLGLYAASQHATKALADSLRNELFTDGIRVLVVHCGRTATPRQHRIFEVEGRAWKPDELLQVTDVADMVMAALRLPRRAEVTELTMLPMWKAPDAAAFSTKRTH